ncbi:hypothetical protein JG677_07000 [Campylobacter sp. TTU-622]|uniref:Uncharacterized protein n=1 Tax=Campylobacter novaezeelandiae TaxID=2267891 RepID=A0A4V2JQE1_9BACT|nr:MULTISPECIES: hypothetical protein [Campylobacter]MBK1964654.1 hypothetical protein [Campylobacter novaezeelandiae]MBK1972148.1 hypothetical protein [Campylobacter sp. TTU_617]MBK1973790.1 hypothetical protein [Campylobacter sp. TTU-622]MBK1991973.1 hypothetical protein [Campylobacter sp. 2018MI34]MBK1993788.1 hypothetical protein [Campylobacter novaezeelandiae]
MQSDNLRRVIINVSAKDFGIRCSEEFANFLEDEIALISGGTKKIELTRFVDAFVKKSYENYITQRELKKLIKTIDEELPLKNEI